MEFCPGGDLHALRQKQPGKFFPEHAARFYLAEVLLSLEYLHMLGIIYRDLKPENVLVREDGHIMLSDFDLSLRCSVSPTLVKSSNPNFEPKSSSGYCVQPACIEPSCVIQPSCFGPRFLGRPKKDKKNTEMYNHLSTLPELMAEPTNAHGQLCRSGLDPRAAGEGAAAPAGVQAWGQRNQAAPIFPERELGFDTVCQSTGCAGAIRHALGTRCGFTGAAVDEGAGS